MKKEKRDFGKEEKDLEILAFIVIGFVLIAIAFLITV